MTDINVTPAHKGKVYNVKIGDHTFQVEVGDLHAEPIIAIVDGTPIEVWPESRNGIQPVARPVNNRPQPAAVQPAPASAPAQAPAPAQAGDSTSGNQLLAPIPGTIVSINVKPGDEVTPGQTLFVLEAMKMKNMIRANRSGKVASICVTTGQIVNHHEVLMEYAE